MKILVTGAAGFVGRSLTSELIQQGLHVRSVTRENNSFVESVDVVKFGEMNSNTNWAIALSGIDVVIHLAARVHVMNDVMDDPLAEFRKVNVESTLNLALQAAAKKVRRFIFISSIKVNGEQTQINQPFTEMSANNPQDAYGISKLEAEQGLLHIAEQTGMEVVIIRPPLIYGPNVKANFASMMRTVQRCIPMPLGAIYNKRSFVYVGNLVSLIIICIDHPAAANQVFLVSDGHDLSTTELLQGCAKALGVKVMLLPLPQKLIEYGAMLLGKRDVVQRLCGNLQVDINKTRTLLNWSPPFSVEHGLQATALELNKVE